MKRPASLVTAAAILLLPMLSTRAGQAAAARPDAVAPAQVEPRAAEILKNMSAFLAKTQRFTLEAEETFDDVREGGTRVQVGALRRITVERPSRLVATASGDSVNRSTWYDGHRLAVLDRDTNRYLSTEVPDTIDGVLDKIAHDYGIVIPLSDFLYANPYEALSEGVQRGQYLGLHLAGNVKCHHLAFAQDDVQWQIWIDAGPDPIPRKLVIAYGDEMGIPQYTANIRRFTVELKAAAESLFKFTPPASAQRIDPARFLDAKSDKP
jgi:hypothetical protein